MIQPSPILVTGISGLIGWHVFQKAQALGQTLGTYNENIRTIPLGGVSRLNICDAQAVDQLISRLKPQIIFHCDAICALNHCERAPDRAFEVNVQGTKNIIQAADQLGIRVIVLSSDLVFDGLSPPFDENDSCRPLHVFGETKARAEELVLQSKGNHAILRPGLTFGSSLQGNKGPSDWMLSRLFMGRPVSLHTDEFRTPIEASLLAEGFVQLGLTQNTGVFHFAGKDRMNRFELGSILIGKRGLSPQILQKKSRLEAIPKRPPDVSLRCSRWLETMGAIPTFKESLARFT